MITFGGLALGIGMLVDNSIVILENIQRQRELGQTPKLAAILGSSEVSTAIVASTMTTICIFVPVVFMTGFASIFFGQMAYVVSFALLSSLAVALTLVPVLASLESQAGSRNKPGSSNKSAETNNGILAGFLNRLESGYLYLLKGSLNRPWLVFIICLTLLGGSIAAIPLIGMELMPEGDQGEVRIYGKLPVGTPLEKTEAVVKWLQSQLAAKIPESVSVMGVAGTPGFWSRSGQNACRIFVKLTNIKDRNRSANQIAMQVRRYLNRIPDFKARVRAGEAFWLFRMLRGGGERISIRILGHDREAGGRLARQVSSLIEEVPGVVDVDIDRKEGNLEAIIRIDADKAADMKLSVGSIADEISTYVLGTASTYFRQYGDEFRVLVRLQESDRRLTSQLLDLPLLTPEGKRISLGDVATIQYKLGPMMIERLNQERLITVNAGFSGRDLGSVTSDIGKKLRQLVLPSNFRVQFSGELEEQKKSFSNLLLGLCLAIALVYMVMASLFESLLHPFVMLLAVPFALIGVVLSLLLTGTTFNINSFLGAIVLCGIVVNNAIVLVDYINLLRSRDQTDLLPAVLEAGRRRLRPILMTSLTTSLALVPVAMGVGEGGEMQAPLARVVVGGLLSSTLITLILVPSLYFSLERWRAR